MKSPSIFSFRTFCRVVPFLLLVASCVDVDVDPTVQAGTDLGAKERRQSVACTADRDCLPTGVCIAGLCGRQCGSEDDCAAGLICSEYRCILAGSNEGDAGSPDSGAPDAVSTGSDTSSTPPEPDSQGSPCGDSDQPYAAACLCKEACQSGLCLIAGDTQGICTKSCISPKECPGTDTCYAVGGGNSVCAPNDSGTPCSEGCYSALSLNNETGQCVCAATCTDANKCPPGFACGLVAAGTGNQKVCVAVGAQCVANEASPCFDKCVTENGVTGYCTASCQSALDCPSGWLCDPGLSVCAQ